MGIMKIRFHTAAAIVVLAVSAIWVGTGEFSSVGSGAADASAERPDAAAAQQTAGGESESGAAGESLQTVAFTVAELARHERWIHLAGQTEADMQVVLVARTSGAIASQSVKDGDHLPEGGLLMAIDGPEKLSALAAARAQFESATLQTESNKRLRESGTLPELQYKASVATLEAARSALEAAQAEVDRLEVHAPFAGIVDKVLVEVGTWVQPGTEVASLLALDPIVVVGEIGERDLQAVKPGARAIVRLGDGTTAEGEVRSLRRAASGLTRTFPVEIAIANPEALIGAGMSAEIRLAAQTEPGVLLPRSAITLDVEGNLGVRVLADDETAKFMPVTIVDDTPEGLILSGIAQGTRIIVSGQDMVVDGQKVIGVEASAEPATGQDSN